MSPSLIDRLVVQRGNLRLIDLRYRRSHCLVDAGIPQRHHQKISALKRRADPPGRTTKPGIEHLCTLFGVEVQVVVPDRNCIGLRCFGGLRFVADYCAAESAEAGGQNRGDSDGLSFDCGLQD